ncbi:RidA family protein [Chondrinema litorale]|uniref:RidA family protein n=1 Tax=Chondrinema litorale TaxID=2994555 RepID=UPI0025427916|nr:RidA family protein [Chondrinema litorale]UZR93767.1 RidA family protein [Chondrinema litorale]
MTRTEAIKFFLVCLLAISIYSCSAPVKDTIDEPAKTEKIIRHDRANSPILKGVSVPAGYSYFFTSGQVGNVLDTTAAYGDPARYGDTYTQAAGALGKIETVLGEAGLTMKDVVFLRVFVAPDTNNENKLDFDGFFKAYGEYFNNEENPDKVARTTLGVASLVREGMFIEIEAVAAYPSN